MIVLIMKTGNGELFAQAEIREFHTDDAGHLKKIEVRNLRIMWKIERIVAVSIDYKIFWKALFLLK